MVSLPYHHPFNVAQRMVQLDHMTGGRAIFGSGPGALASDAHTLGIDPMLQRDRQDEAIGVIRRLFKGERVTDKGEWYTMHDAALQLLPLQEDMPFAVASQISPSGMTLAGKYGIGIISIGSMSNEGLTALPTQWSFAEDAAKKHGQTVDRRNWRVLLTWHIAETREKAREEARVRAAPLAQRVHRRHAAAARRGGLQDPGRGGRQDGLHAGLGRRRSARRTTWCKVIKDVYAKSGGFGTVVGFVHDWANPENTLPQLGHGRALRRSPRSTATWRSCANRRSTSIENRGVFERAQQAIMAKIMENEDGAEALKVTKSPRFAAASAAVPDFEKENAR